MTGVVIVFVVAVVVVVDDDDDGAASAASTQKAHISTLLPRLPPSLSVSADSRRWRFELPETSLVVSSSSSSSLSSCSLPPSSSVSDPRHDDDCECECARGAPGADIARGTGDPCGVRPEDDGVVAVVVVLGSTRLRAFHSPRGRFRPRRASRGQVPPATAGGEGTRAASIFGEFIIGKKKRRGVGGGV